MLSEEIIPDYKVRENGYFLKTEAVVLLFFYFVCHKNHLHDNFYHADGL